MSNWIEITDPEDIDITTNLTHEGNVTTGAYYDVDIKYSSDNNGNNYVTIPLNLLLKRLRDLKVIE